MDRFYVPAIAAIILLSVIGAAVWLFLPASQDGKITSTAIPDPGKPNDPPGQAQRSPAPAPQPSEPANEQAGEQPATSAGGDSPRVRFETSLGGFTVELYSDKTPKTVANFLKYVDEDYYSGTIFHRIIPTFMIQGGGFAALGQEKKAGLHDPIQNEARTGLKNTRGTIAMARTGAPHSATSQFFVNVADNAFLDYPGRDGWGYCAFGKVIDGMDVVDKLKAVPTKSGGEGSEPADPPTIQSVKRVTDK